MGFLLKIPHCNQKMKRENLILVLGIQVFDKKFSNANRKKYLLWYIENKNIFYVHSAHIKACYFFRQCFKNNFIFKVQYLFVLNNFWSDKLELIRETSRKNHINWNYWFSLFQVISIKKPPLIFQFNKEKLRMLLCSRLFRNIK